jgi:hypothetical protein
MASISLAAGKIAATAKTLTANTADTVTFADDLDQVEVSSDGTAALYFTVDGSTPAIGGDNCWELPAGALAARVVPVPTSGGTVVKLLSAGTPKYSVSRVS